MMSFRSSASARLPRLRQLVWGLALVGSLVGKAEPANAHPGSHARLERASAQIESAPGVAAHYVERAEIRCEHHDIAGAERDFATAQRLAPRDVELRLRETQAWYDAGKKRAATESATRMIALDRERSDVLLLAALVHEANGRTTQAVRAAQLAVSAAERPDVLLFAHRARILIGAGPEYEDAAVAGLYEALIQVGANIVLVELAIRAESARKRPDAARGLIQFLPPRLQHAPKWELRRAQLLATEGLTDAACVAFHQTLQTVAQAPASQQAQDAIKAVRKAAHSGVNSLECVDPAL